MKPHVGVEYLHKKRNDFLDVALKERVVGLSIFGEAALKARFIIFSNTFAIVGKHV